MTYKLDFKKSALKEWKKLGSTLQQQFKKKLIERLDNPHVPASKLSGADNMYKIKLRQSGYRLVYKVEDDVIIVTVLAVGKRERSDVYRKAMKRLDDWLRYNAALRGECRINQPSAEHFHHQNSPHTKNATRHESHLNALLCLSFNGLRFSENKINSTLIQKQKPRLRKPKWIIVLTIRLGILADLVWSLKPTNEFLIELTALTSRLPENWMRQFSEFLASKNKCPKNSAKNSQLADKRKTNQLREQRKTITNWFYVIKHNALLRGEQRNTYAAAYHLNHLNQRIVKMPRVANPSWTVC